MAGNVCEQILATRAARFRKEDDDEARSELGATQDELKATQTELNGDKGGARGFRKREGTPCPEVPHSQGKGSRREIPQRLYKGTAERRAERPQASG